mmetsp:Transcript_61873/g.152353  ORF Transcript_61873/g.152353 Transcript_61873/m.152353 type:complete len:101 (+) Transcript_61873:615-917(+)
MGGSGVEALKASLPSSLGRSCFGWWLDEKAGMITPSVTLGDLGASGRGEVKVLGEFSVLGVPGYPAEPRRLVVMLLIGMLMLELRLWLALWHADDATLVA